MRNEITINDRQCLGCGSQADCRCHENVHIHSEPRQSYVGKNSAVHNCACGNSAPTPQEQELEVSLNGLRELLEISHDENAGEKPEPLGLPIYNFDEDEIEDEEEPALEVSQSWTGAELIVNHNRPQGGIGLPSYEFVSATPKPKGVLVVNRRSDGEPTPLGLPVDVY